ncbi:hypothetical protein [Flavivirga eckloniae]|uniref:DUF4468 domain-containing protein n=1 Tax=Flavivirga eckloniae TaxID=1803846 RepID=A0A2K9PSD5_9FLAO|nr:hypothetical protein [Flavivirga eckloniae]AUP79970.1 hypothetical protein C1H87_15170 [Flavivirga eckloniae]
MKSIIPLAIILISSFINAQNTNDSKFVYGENGLEPRHITIDIKGMDMDEMQTKAEEWLNEKYEAPKGKSDSNNDKKIKPGKSITAYEIYEDNEGDATGKANNNKKLRFTGFTNNAICIGKGADYSCETVEYTIELRLRDGDLRFKPIKLTYKGASDKKEQTINLKKNKFAKNGAIIDGYEKASSQIETLLNSLRRSIVNYLTGKAQEEEW